MSAQEPAAVHSFLVVFFFNSCEICELLRFVGGFVWRVAVCGFGWKLFGDFCWWVVGSPVWCSPIDRRIAFLMSRFESCIGS